MNENEKSNESDLHLFAFFFFHSCIHTYRTGRMSINDGPASVAFVGTLQDGGLGGDDDVASPPRRHTCPKAVWDPPRLNASRPPKAQLYLLRHMQAHDGNQNRECAWAHTCRRTMRRRLWLGCRFFPLPLQILYLFSVSLSASDVSCVCMCTRAPAYAYRDHIAPSLFPFTIPREEGRGLELPFDLTFARAYAYHDHIAPFLSIHPQRRRSHGLSFCSTSSL